MRFRNGSRTSCGCCDPCSDLSARIDAAQADATAAMAQADTAIGIANAQAGAAAASAASAASDAASALAQATNAATSAADALTQANNAASSASDAAADAASALLAVASKVAIRTTTGTFVYSHTNATEGEIAVINDAATGNTMPARDGSGYIIAETPASGDNSKKVATTAFVEAKDTFPQVKVTNVNYQFRKETATLTTAYADKIIYDTTNSRWMVIDRIINSSANKRSWELHMRAENTNTDIIPIQASVDVDGTTVLKGVDPPSGDTSQKLVTTNWISQTGDSSPNNVVHRSGNETIQGQKTFTSLTPVMSRSYLFQRVTAENKWFKVFTFDNAARNIMTLDVIWGHQSYNGYGIGKAVLAAIGSSTIAKWLYRAGNASAFTADTIFIGVDTTNGKIDVWVKGGYFVYCEISRAIRGNVETGPASISISYDGNGVTTIDTTLYNNFAYGTE